MKEYTDYTGPTGMSSEHRTRDFIARVNFKRGYESGRTDHRRVEWLKLFLLIIVGSFLGHFLWALVATMFS